LESAYDKSPSIKLLADAGQCLGKLGFLREHAAKGRVRRELLLVESEADILMGKLVWDASGRRDREGPLAYLDRVQFL
jgi:hypothetical protein